MPRLALLGCGAMGKDILRVLSDASTASSTSSSSDKTPIFSAFTAVVTRESSAQKLTQEFGDKVQILLNDSVNAAQEADVVMLAFPPDQTKKVLSTPGLSSALRDKLVVSVLAGVTRQSIQEHLGSSSTHIVRILPSLATRAGSSATLLVLDPSDSDSSCPLPERHQTTLDQVLTVLGRVHPTPSSLVDEMTALTAFTHAVVAVAVDAVEDAAAAQGVPGDDARLFVASCLQGYAALLARGDDPRALKKSMMIARGITVNAVVGLERRGLRGVLSETLADAVAYTRTLGKD